MSLFGVVLVSLLSMPWLGRVLWQLLIMVMFVCIWLCFSVSPLCTMAWSVNVTIPDHVHVCLFLALFWRLSSLCHGMVYFVVIPNHVYVMSVFDFVLVSPLLVSWVGLWPVVVLSPDHIRAFSQSWQNTHCLFWSKCNSSSQNNAFYWSNMTLHYLGTTSVLIQYDNKMILKFSWVPWTPITIKAPQPWLSST